VLCAENAPLVPATPVPTLVNRPHPITPSASSVDSADTLRCHIPDLTPLRLKSSANTSVMSVGLITRDRHLSGLQLNLLGGDVEQRLRGAQISGFLSVVRGEAEGVQLAPLYNYASRIRGAQIASMFNITEQAARGWQAAAATNLAVEGDGIVQTALTNVVLGRMRGVQLGATNYAGQFRGVQIGVVNVAMGTSNGLQLGVLNFTRDTSAVKVGLVNLTPATRVQLLLFGGNVTKSNLAVRFLNHHFYTLLGFSLYYRGLDDRFSGALYYRAGYRVNVARRLALSGDLGLAHIEDAPAGAEQMEERRLGIQARLNVEMQISPRFSVFATGGWRRAHRYGHFRDGQRKAIAEMGLMFF
jgi:hypothetical protein